ncbi:MAG TPA: AAA family ATPase, partial [Pseudomonadales bacterium]|nr:AAA family ATPase [Pseudomonadales bacterium]
MVAVDLKSLISTLDQETRTALENAAGLAMSRGHHAVELEHWLAKLLENASGQLAQLLSDQFVDLDRCKYQINLALEQFRSGNTRPPALSPHIVAALQNAFLLAGVEFRQTIISTAVFVYALLQDQELRQSLTGCAALQALSLEGIKAFISRQPGAELAKTQLASATGSALQRFTINLTEQARQGKIDPVIGRELEIRQCIDILMRRRQNNPILTGEAGVGKTAVVEGLARRIVEGDVPDALKKVELLTLDLGLLQAGAAIKGEFEERLRQVITEVQASSSPVILFIDEAHTLIGAGGKEGQGDAANLLKPALARGELRTIAATTWVEYKKYFERDPALTRRFQVIKVEEPNEAIAEEMLRAVAESMQKHHGIRVLDEAVAAAVRLSKRYLPERQLPDKAISVLDTACARAALSHVVQPQALEALNKKIFSNEKYRQFLLQEAHLDVNAEQQLSALDALLDELYTQKNQLESRWQQQKHLLGEMRELEQAIAQGSTENVAFGDGLRELRGQIGAEPLIFPYVDGRVIAQVIADWTGVPLNKILHSQQEGVLQLQTQLSQRIVGQAHAVEKIAQQMQIANAGLNDPGKPLGVFMLLGPSGVGKTETA